MPQRHATFILIGCPNSGKTSLFNWLTASQIQATNYPGSTVHIQKGSLYSFQGKSREQTPYTLVDTPGIYSLDSQTEEEQLTKSLLFENKTEINIEGLVFVLDARKLKQQLPLLFQIKALKNKDVPLHLAITMADQIEETESLYQIIEKLQIPYTFVDGRLGKGVKELFSKIEKESKGSKKSFSQAPLSLDKKLFKTSKVKGLEFLQENNLSPTKVKQQSFYWDRWFLDPFWGPTIFLITSILLFTSLFWAAAPFMDGIDTTISMVSDFIENQSSSLWALFLSQGLVQGAGAVLIFIPQIFILFFLLGLLDDSGYLARASALMDRFLSLFKLSGKSFVPLLSSFACAVPALMATRHLPNRRQKLLTMVAIPFLTCSASLPVYTLLIAFLLPGASVFSKGLLMAAIYILSFLVGAIASLFIAKVLKTDAQENNLLLLELPAFQKPNLWFATKNALRRTKNYLTKAGPVIFLVSLLVWTASTFPLQDQQTPAAIENSYMGQVGQILEPVFLPMGSDWRMGVSLLSSFAAREVFVSTLSILIVGEESDPDDPTLFGSLKSLTYADGTPLLTFASVMALLTFFLLALQCFTTSVMVHKEYGSLRFTLLQFFGMNLFAYVVAVLLFQGLA